ncbi:PIN domain-containing protein [Nonomuraea roseola]|uniref:PIN domain-containing protein n=1 Tax=Nonomuraea roseola TaxID=46179 RepID=A0ABV5QF43_9ACTN
MPDRSESYITTTTRVRRIIPPLHSPPAPASRELPSRQIRSRRRDPAQAAAFESWLSRLQNEFGLRIAPVTAEVAEEWGRFNAVRTVPVIDGLVGATARAHGWTLATRNTKDFAGLDLEVVNPFEWPV